MQASYAQSIESLVARPGSPNTDSPSVFTVTLSSDTGSYACAFEIDFGDGTSPEKRRVFRESDRVINASHTYSSAGSYTVTARGFFSFLDSGPSIQSLLPTVPCVGTKSVVVSVQPVASECIAPREETRVIDCPSGAVGKIYQRRSFSCPGPMAGPWVVTSDDCKISPIEPPERSPDSEASALIAAGWRAFVGSSGGVEEFEAVRMTSEGVRLSRISGATNALSVGLNNLSVFHRCSSDTRIRDYDLGKKIASSEVGKNSYSSDNFIWGVFLRREVADTQKFVSFLNTYEKNHSVTAYLRKSSGRLPKDTAAAVKFLKNEASKGDYQAAKWVAFHYECGMNQIDISTAKEWMALAVSNARKSDAPINVQRAIEERLSRLVILGKRF